MIKENLVLKYLNELFEHNKYEMNNVRDFEYDYSDKIIISIETGGDRGGNHYDGVAQSYRISEEEQINNLFDELHYYLNKIIPDLDKVKTKPILYPLCEKIIYQEISNYSSNSDYYGNSTEYSLFSITQIQLLSPFLDKDNLISFDNILKTESAKFKNVIDIDNINKKLLDVNKKLDNFKQIKNETELKLIKELENYKKHVVNLENLIKNHEKNYDKELSILITNKDTLEKSLINLSNKPETKKIKIKN